MSGKPAARQGDATAKGGPITQGSSTVLIGSNGGVACSSCPGGIAVGSPVNPMLGAKVLSAETDVALPAPLGFTLSRSYSSYQTDTPAPVDLLGPGWQMPSDVRLRITDDELILNDNGGRSIHFEWLSPGEITFSRSEHLWLARGGSERLVKSHALERVWQALPDEVRLNRHLYLVANDALGPWWVLGYSEPYVPDNTDILPQPLPSYRTLQGLINRFGDILRYHREPAGPYKDRVTVVTDSAGRRYRFELTTLAGDFSAKTGWGKDNGVRLKAVYLEHDPVYGPFMEGPLASYAYTAKGELATVYDRTGQPVRHFRYHPHLTGRMVAHRFAGRPESSYQYDVQGRVVAQANPDGLNYRFDYQPDSTVVTDSLSRKEVYHFQGEGGLKRLVKHERADGTATQREYDGSGRLMADIDPLGRKTEYNLNVGNGRLLGITTHDGRKTRFDYNRQGQVTQTIAPDDSRTRQAYDALGRLTESHDPMGRTTRYHYPDDASELPDTITDPAGGEKHITWTTYGQPATYTDCSGKQTRYHYDRWGQTILTEREGGLRTRYRYDGKGRLSELENAEGEITRYRYNEAGDLLTTTYPDGSEEQFSYTPHGRPASYLKGGLTQRFEYDAAGRLTTLVNENGTETLFVYDPMDRLVQETGFDGRTQRYHYNPIGLLLQSDDAGRVIDWHYDAADRLSRRVWQTKDNNAENPQEEHWRYDIMGRLADASHYSQGHRVSIQYQYNRAGQVTEEQQQVLNPGGKPVWQHKVSHEYDAQGLRSVSQPDGLPPLRWQTYGSGHLLGLALGDQSLVEFTRDDLHREQERRFGQYVLNSHYTPAGRLDALLHDDNARHPLSRSYRYDKRGLLTTLLVGGSDEYRYGYDAAGRLTEATTPYYQQQYRFDPAGNRQFTAGNTPTNRLSESEHYRYRYDAFGNLTEKLSKDGNRETHHYAYDSSHRLSRYRRITHSSTQAGQVLTALYLYDPLGRRVGKQTSVSAPGGQGAPRVQTFWYGWEGDTLTVTEHNGRQTHTVYHPGNFVPLVRVEGDRPPVTLSLAERLAKEAEVTFPPVVIASLDKIEKELRANVSELSVENQQWLTMTGFSREGLSEFLDPIPPTERQLHLYHCDHLGTPQALISQSGNVEWQAELDPWGNVVRERNSGEMYQPIRMQGQHYDDESGLFYNRHRYYDPETGRYVTQDPIGLVGGGNSYIYPLSPLQSVDPQGLFAILIPFIPEIAISAGAIIKGLIGGTALAAILSIPGDTAKTENDGLTKCQTKQCPPCTPPAGEMFDKVTHYEAHSRDLNKGSHGCMQKTGSPVHWHYKVNHQIPYPSCECKLDKHAFGGCGPAPL